MKRIALYMCLHLMVLGNVFSQLRVNISDDAITAATDSLFLHVPGIEVIEANYWGSAQAIGFYELHTHYNTLDQTGVILSTGDVRSAVGPNETSTMSGTNRMPGSARLNRLINGEETFDAAILTFEFIAEVDSISFEYFFASEEYPEYVNRNANDVFAFYLNDLETDETRNLAVIGAQKALVCIDEINEFSNSDQYIANAFWDKNNIRQWAEHRMEGELALMIQFDGFTKGLVAGAKLVKGRKYRLELVIADVGDYLYDSAVFIRAHSFRSHLDGLNKDQEWLMGLSDVIELTDENEILIHKDVHFESASHVVSDPADLDFLAQFADGLQKMGYDSLVIIGYTDSVGSESNNLLLSQRRAEAIRQTLVEMGLTATRVVALGRGESLSKETDELNRRVEFLVR